MYIFKRDIFFILLGFGATASLLALPIWGHLLSLFTVALFVVLFILLQRECKKSIPFTILDKLYCSWIFWAIVSSFFGFFFFWGEWEWQQASLSYIPKILLYLLLFYLLRKSSNRKQYCALIVKGLFIGIIVNILWAVLDASLFYLKGYSITNETFTSYIALSNMRYSMISLIYGPTIRSCGLNSDPANIGIFVAIVAAYSLKVKKNIYLLFAIMGTLASLSHTAFFSIVLVIFVFMLTNKVRYIQWVKFFLFVLVFVFLLTLMDFSVFSQMQEAFIERSNDKIESGSDMEGARGSYWLNFIPAVLLHPISFIVGTGYGTASYPYLANGLVDALFFPYDPEQTYFSTFFDIGLFGFICFFKLYLKLYLLSNNIIESNILDMVNAGILGCMVAFLGYHYSVYSVAMIIVIVGIILLDEKHKEIRCNYEKGINNNSNI